MEDEKDTGHENDELYRCEIWHNPADSHDLRLYTTVWEVVKRTPEGYWIEYTRSVWETDVDASPWDEEQRPNKRQTRGECDPYGVRRFSTIRQAAPMTHKKHRKWITDRSTFAWSTIDGAVRSLEERTKRYVQKMNYQLARAKRRYKFLEIEDGRADDQRDRMHVRKSN